MGEAGADVVGVDWRTPLDAAIPQVGRPCGAGQPRPDPGLRPDRGDDRAGRRGHRGRRAAAKGHIFNLGHGVIPSHRPRPAARRLTEFVQGY